MIEACVVVIALALVVIAILIVIDIRSYCVYSKEEETELPFFVVLVILTELITLIKKKALVALKKRTRAIDKTIYAFL